MRTGGIQTARLNQTEPVPTLLIQGILAGMISSSGWIPSDTEMAVPRWIGQKSSTATITTRLWYAATQMKNSVADPESSLDTRLDRCHDADGSNVAYD